MSSEKDPLKNILYISLPEDAVNSIGDFLVDSSILLPIEVEASAGEEWDPEQLSWEMIITGILKVLAYQPDNKDCAYYRDFALAVKPELPAELGEMGLAKAVNKDFDMAEEIFLALRGIAPTDNRALLNLALLYEAKADNYKSTNNNEMAAETTVMAESAYRDALYCDEPLPETLFAAAGFFYKIDQPLPAIDYYKRYIEVGSDQDKIDSAKARIMECEAGENIDNSYKQAHELIKNGKEEEGLETLDEYLSLNPHSWHGWFLQGWGYRRLEKFDKALIAFKKAEDLSPPSSDILNERAICEMELGNNRESWDCLERALRIAPDDVTIISNMGILAYKEGRQNEAEDFFRIVLDLNPDDPIASKFLENK